MVDITQYQEKIIINIEDLVNTAGILNAELTDKVREIAEKIPHLK
ncbi:8349_t:CDS:1, partial [Ambispora leptoticha]